VGEQEKCGFPQFLQGKTFGRYFIIENRVILLPGKKANLQVYSKTLNSGSTEDLRSLLLKMENSALRGIYFDTAAATVKKESYGITIWTSPICFAINSGHSTYKY